MLPVAFLGHGSPLTALEEGAYQDTLRAFGKELRTSHRNLRAIVVFSAHWFTRGGISVGGAARPETLYDFRGFPKALSEIRYPAPGDPSLAAEIVDRLNRDAVFQTERLPARIETSRGLDHGVWTPLRFLFPEAEIPVVQVSLPVTHSALLSMEQAALALGQALAPLRGEGGGVLFLGSGNITHNLGELDSETPEAPAEDWALAFEAWAVSKALGLDARALVRWKEDAPFALRAHPSPDHWLPLLAAVGVAQSDASIGAGKILFQGMRYAHLSMTSLVWPSPVKRIPS
jgi:4,5-DOPA dioxygenase extradiol